MLKSRSSLSSKSPAWAYPFQTVSVKIKNKTEGTENERYIKTGEIEFAEAFWRVIKKISAGMGFIKFLAGHMFLKLSAAIGLQTNLDQSWHLTIDIFGEKPALHLLRKPIFTLHENVRFGSFADVCRNALFLSPMPLELSVSTYQATLNNSFHCVIYRGDTAGRNESSIP